MGVSARAWPRGPNTPLDKVRELQRRLFMAAKADPKRRFHALYDRICRGDVLGEAWRRVRSNRGAAGVDGETLAAIEQRGVAGVPRGTRGAPEGGHVPTAAGAAAVHPEAGREAAAVGDSDGARPRGADGGEDRARADLRGRVPGLFLRVPPATKCHAGAGGDPPDRRTRPPVRRRRGHQGLLRLDRPGALDGTGRATDLGSAGAQAAAAVAAGRGHGGGRGADRPLRGHPKAA